MGWWNWKEEEEVRGDPWKKHRQPRCAGTSTRPYAVAACPVSAMGRFSCCLRNKQNWCLVRLGCCSRYYRQEASLANIYFTVLKAGQYKTKVPAGSLQWWGAHSSSGMAILLSCQRGERASSLDLLAFMKTLPL